MRSRLHAAIPVAASLFLVAAVSHRLLAADGKIDISGRWKLNDGLSDNPFEKMQEARGGGGARRGEGGAGGGGSRGGWGRGGGGFGGSTSGMRGRNGSGGSGGEDGASRIQDLLEETRQLSILQKEPELRITTASGQERILWLDGRKVKVEKDEGTITTKTKRKGATIVVDTEYPSGREIVETYELLPEIRHLVVTTKVSPPKGRSFSFRRVYDPADEGIPVPDPGH